jgi:Protein of unknown function (DUF2950)
MTTWTSVRRAAAGTLAAIMASALMSSACPAQQSFSSPDAAADALAAAVKNGTKRQLLKVLGNAAEEIIDSGDDVADARTRNAFISTYDARHSIQAGGNQKATLILGTEDFQFPIPLVNRTGGWEFDASAGRLEILYRRIGRNELDAIQTCLAFVDAQKEYAEKDHGDGVGVYAQRIVSSAGKKDGLFWRDDADPSPLGELAAQASAEGYRLEKNGTPYHGYYFRVLKGQGPDAPGGALYYVVRGKMIGGFALLAYPADYGNSGVMSFVVNHAGTVYQKDLGRRTYIFAKYTTLFDPDQTWKKVDTANLNEK